MAASAFNFSAEDQGRNKFGSTIWAAVFFTTSLLSLILWAGGGYVWTHTETKLGYAIMKKIGKIEPVKRFEPYEAPAGVFHSPKELVGKLDEIEVDDKHFQNFNRQALRAYILNYFKQRDLVTYLHGEFNILEIERIGKGRFVPGGVVLLAQAEEAPGLLIEYILPTTPDQTDKALELLRPGMRVTLQKSNDLGTVLRVTRQPDRRLIVSVINLLYGDYSGMQDGQFTSEPPPSLEPETGWPVFAKTREVLARLAPLVPEHITSNVAPVTRPELKKEEAPKPFLPAQAPVAPSAPAPPSSGEDMAVTILSAPAGSPSEIISATMNSEAPAARPPALTTAPAAPPATNPVRPAGSVSTATPTPAPSPPAWPVFAGGEAPPARLVGVERLPRLAKEGLPSEPLYLGGEFIVSAVGPGGVVMRSKGPDLQPFLPDGNPSASVSNIRVIAQFPPDAKLPARGETIVRDRRRPFEIIGASTGTDGSTNVRVRELTVP